MSEEEVLERAQEAGGTHARAQLEGAHFTDWVREQLSEAARMRAEDPSSVLPLETKKDARVVAKNMLQQLGWDARHQMDERDIRSLLRELVGDLGDVPLRAVARAFFEGFDEALRDRATVDWLADEVLTIHKEIRSGPGAREGRTRVRNSPKPKHEPVDDPTYVIQGLYLGGTLASVEFGFDDEAVAIDEAKTLRRSPHFNGDYVRVITRDGELVWDSRKKTAQDIPRRRPITRTTGARRPRRNRRR